MIALPRAEADVKRDKKVEIVRKCMVIMRWRMLERVWVVPKL